MEAPINREFIISSHDTETEVIQSEIPIEIGLSTNTTSTATPIHIEYPDNDLEPLKKVKRSVIKASASAHWHRIALR